MFKHETVSMKIHFLGRRIPEISSSGKKVTWLFSEKKSTGNKVKQKKSQTEKKSNGKKSNGKKVYWKKSQLEKI